MFFYPSHVSIRPYAPTPSLRATALPPSLTQLTPDFISVSQVIVLGLGQLIHAVQYFTVYGVLVQKY